MAGLLIVVGAWLAAAVAGVEWLDVGLWSPEWWGLIVAAALVAAGINIFARSLNNIDKYFEALLRKKEELEADDARP